MTDPSQRRAIATRAARSLRAARDTLRTDHAAFVGFDGFIDAILRAVDTRTSMDDAGYTPIATIAEFADRCAAAAGRSTNIEVVERERRFGGNGPLLAGALASLAMPVTYAGAVGASDDPARLDPIYEPLEARCVRVISLGPPGWTDAIEFDDGKIMLNKSGAMRSASWTRLVERVGLEHLRAIVGSSTLVAMVNWSLCGEVESIWAGLRDELLEPIPQPDRPAIFIDLSDPAKRSDDDLNGALALLASLSRLAPVTLGLNLAEAQRVAQVAGLGQIDQPDAGPSRGLDRAADQLRARLGLDCVVIHPRKGAGGADASGCAWFDGPFTRRPVLSTGAGDHFNAGFILARTLGLSLAESLASGVATSGAYVRSGASPTLESLAELLDDLPGPDPNTRPDAMKTGLH